MKTEFRIALFSIFAIVVLVLIFFVLQPSKNGLFATDCTHYPKELNCVHYVRNYDGDTITFNIDGLHPLIGKKISIRVNGIDTAEIRTTDACEKLAAQRAKVEVEKILSKAKNIRLVNVERGKYFRIVADVYADNVSVGSLLLSKKLAYRYDGGTKLPRDWCGIIQ